MEKFITEISESDFRKLNLIGYRNTRVDVDEKSYKMEMMPIELNKILDQNLDFCKEEGFNTVAIALHTDPTEESVQTYMKLFTFDKEHGKRNYTYEEAKGLALFDFSYLDKFMNRFSGHQTFQIGCGITHLYSTRDYWEIRDDYWRVKKSETKAIYLIHLGI